MDKKWWKNAVVYQIYPRSFQDSNGDGIGDIQGIIQRLDYLEKLGINVIWLSPVYESPNDDNGYDISDYYAIMAEFGTMEDMELLIAEAKKRNIRLVMDLVVNHTSDEHAWFIEAKKSKENPYRDYYIWRDPVNGDVPNGLGSVFSGSAWEYEEETEQYFMHLFSKRQPDLNWENKDMRYEIYDMMNFWLDKGIGGFRLDVIELVGKLPDQEITAHGPKLHEYLQEMNRETFGKQDVMTVGETNSANPQQAKLFSGADRKELSMVFQFEHMALDQQPGKAKWDLRPLSVVELKQVLSTWQVELQNEGWNSLFWNNHDQPRIVSRWGNDQEHRVESAKMFAILLHMMKGTPYIYQGEEIGMTNITLTDISQADDVETKNMYHERLAEGYSKEAVLASINAKGRDNARTPIQWEDSKEAGFTTGQPWLPVNPNYPSINVKQALADPKSIFYTYQKLIQLRKENPLMVYGDYQLLAEEDESLFAYTRTFQGETWLVVANFSEQVNKFQFTEETTELEPIISNSAVKRYDLNQLQLDAYETFVVKLDSPLYVK
ncbi:glycoside hydrolase family 13 protein [Desemzia sp. FAM 23989]|uniref:glycoside hydrolase family 13 protein n=1 Tax=Desemzia sp. FAM 23989 TaxID=3259523 RepID=UPI00388AFD84